jgi:peptidoglycan/LPS O-acetylase OafA/YrhL
MINSLTSVRFFFAFVVFLSHLKGLVGKSENFDFYYDNVFSEGSIGVSFFFILSGFVLSLSYEKKIIAGYKRSTFYFKRVARLFPLHLITFIVAIPFALHGGHFLLKGGLNLLLLQSFIPLRSIYFSFNAVSWSISDEMFFYALFPFLITWINSRNKYLKYLIYLFPLVPIALNILLPEEYKHQLLYINPIVRLADFILGILGYKLFSHFKNYKNVKWINTLQLTSVVVFVIFFMYHLEIPKALRYSVYYWIPMVFIILAFSFNEGVVYKLLNKRILIYLGEISFGFYMIHQLVIRYLGIINSKSINIDSVWILLVVFFVTSICLSVASFELFEKPVNRWLNKKFGAL